jgi:hypothetical protein
VVDEADGINISDLTTSLPSDRFEQQEIEAIYPDPYVVGDAGYVPPQLVVDEGYIPDRRYPLRNRIQNKVFCNGFRVCAVHTKDSLICPTLNQALKASDDQIKLWRLALMAELKTLQKLDTYDVVNKEDIPADAFIFPSKMVLKQKMTPLGEYIKHKARLTVLGNLD